MDEHVIQTYRRAAPVFVHGAGARLTDADGKEYLDFLGGIAVSALGHDHPGLVAALRDQVGKMLHVSNLYRHPYTEEVARRVTGLAGMNEVFFSNSGTEANEAALKIARKHHWNHGTGRSGFVALERGFHGRTMGALSVTHKRSFRTPFEPLIGGVQFVPPGDEAALVQAFESAPAALILEPIQGEAGIHELSTDYLRFCRALCSDTGTLLIHDEIQSGSGRTGDFLAAQTHGVRPDIVTLAKPIAAGLPLGMTLIDASLHGTLVPGDHGSTFAGGPLVCRAALVFLTELSEGGLLEQVRRRGEYLTARLDELAATHEAVRARRGRGLIQALQLAPEWDAPALQSALFARGLIVNATGPDTLRLLPPYVITDADIDAAVERIEASLSQTTSTTPTHTP